MAVDNNQSVLTEKEWMALAWDEMNQKTKPPGALGVLESTGVRLGALQKTLRPSVEKKRMIIFAASHGVAVEGVSAFPAEVTPQMVLNFLTGGAAINVLTRFQGIDLKVVDVGVDVEWLPEVCSNPKLVRASVRRGTRSFLKEPAMTTDERDQAIEVGRKQLRDALADQIQLVGIGEMGIGNTTSAAALFSALYKIPASDIVGRGTGVDDRGLMRKIEVIEQSLKLHQQTIKTNDAMSWLAAVGGYEIAAMTGVILQANETRTPVVVDGFIATAAAAVAICADPKAAEVCFFSHCSHEQGHRRVLQMLGGEPLLDLQLRLGEGSGAALAMSLIDASAHILSEMATFKKAGVSEKAS